MMARVRVFMFVARRDGSPPFSFPLAPARDGETRSFVGSAAASRARGPIACQGAGGLTPGLRPSRALRPVTRAGFRGAPCHHVVMRRHRDVWLLALLLAIGAWPWIGGLSSWPTTADPPVWIGRASTFAPGWLEWVLAGPHFTWYRPVTALSFTLNELATGLAPAGFRSVDLALHLACAALVFALLRALAPGAPSWAPLAAAALFLAHPAAEEVVPYIARRSYTLCTALGLGALLALARGRSRVAAPLLFLALLSNEAALAYVALTPAIARVAPGPDPRTWRTALRSSAVPLGAALFALVLRTLALGGPGGYGPGVDERGGLAGAWTDLLVLPREASWPWLAAAAAVGLFYAREALRSPRRLLFAAWLVATWLLLALSGSWFDRQLYLLAVPFALLVADVLGGTRRLPVLVPQALLVGWLLAHSPLLRGPDSARVERFRERHAAIEALRSAAEACEEPAFLIALLPGARRVLRPHAIDGLHRSVRQTALWTRVLLHDRDIELVEAVYYEPGQADPIRLDLGARPAFVVAPGVPFYVLANDRFVRGAELGRRRFPLAGLAPPPGRHAYVYRYDGERGELTPLP